MSDSACYFLCEWEIEGFTLGRDNNNYTHAQLAVKDCAACQALGHNCYNLKLTDCWNALIKNLTEEQVAGKKLVYDHGNLGGDMDVIESRQVYNDNDNSSGQVILRVAKSDTLTFSNISGDFSVGITGDNYCQASVNNAEKVVFTNGRGVEIEGNNYDFNLDISNAETGTKLVRVNGKSDGKTTVSNVGKDVLVKADRITDIYTATFNNLDSEFLTIDDEVSELKISDCDDGDKMSKITYTSADNSEPTENCTCNCHKGGIAGFFFRFILFFQKIFGLNRICACGKAHY